MSLLLLILGSAPASAGDANGVLFDEILRANGDGTSQELILAATVAQGRQEIAVDSQSIYWTAGLVPHPFLGATAHIRKSTVSGTGVHNIVNPSNWGGIAVDPDHAKLYLSPVSDCAPGCTSIIRCNLDGSNIESMFPAGSPGSIAVHPGQQLVCWWDIVFGPGGIDFGILCAHVGDAEGDMVVAAAVVNGLAIDSVHDKLYWTTDHEVRRSNLDGSSVEDLVTGLPSAEGITVDPQGSHIWWTEPSAGRIRRAGLDGSGVQHVVTGQTRPSGISFRPGAEGGQIYWLDLVPDADIVPALSPRGVVVLLLAALGAFTAFLLRARRAT